MSKPKNLNATLIRFKPKKIIKVRPQYYQDGKWYYTNTGKPVKRSK